MSDELRNLAHNVHDRIRDLAYAMWDAAGRQQGMAMEYWLAAEREVLATVKAAAHAITGHAEQPPPVKQPKPAAAAVSAPSVKPADQQKPTAAKAMEAPAKPAATPEARVATTEQVPAKPSAAKTEDAPARPAAAVAKTEPSPSKPAAATKGSAPAPTPPSPPTGTAKASGKKTKS
jgi:hypothetical protein